MPLALRVYFSQSLLKDRLCLCFYFGVISDSVSETLFAEKKVVEMKFTNPLMIRSVAFQQAVENLMPFSKERRTSLKRAGVRALQFRSLSSEWQRQEKGDGSFCSAGD